MTSPSSASIPARGASPLWFGLGSRPYLLLILTMLFWSGNWVVGRALRHDVSPLSLTFWRWVTGLVVFLPFALPGMIAQRAVIFRSWKIMLVFSVLGVPLFHLLVMTALSLTTALNAALTNSIMPVMIVGMSWAIYRERITGRQGWGIAVSFAGAAVIVTHGDWEVVRSLRFNPGDLWALSTVPVWALYSVLLRSRPAELKPTAFLGTVILVGVVVMTPFYLWHAGVEPRALRAGALVGIVFMGVFPAVLSYTFWNRAVEMVGANRAGQFNHLVPVFAALWAILLLGESLRPFHAAGAGLIAAGIYLANIRRG